MKVIDTRTGAEIGIGDSFYIPEVGTLKLLTVQEQFFSAQGLFEHVCENPNCKPRVVELIVRYTHPSFFGRKVAFIPS